MSQWFKKCRVIAKNEGERNSFIIPATQFWRGSKQLDFSCTSHVFRIRLRHVQWPSHIYYLENFCIHMSGILTLLTKYHPDHADNAPGNYIATAA